MVMSYTRSWTQITPVRKVLRSVGRAVTGIALNFANADDLRKYGSG